MLFLLRKISLQPLKVFVVSNVKGKRHSRVNLGIVDLLGGLLVVAYVILFYLILVKWNVRQRVVRV